jgi:hypothetical protein
MICRNAQASVIQSRRCHHCTPAHHARTPAKQACHCFGHTSPLLLDFTLQLKKREALTSWCEFELPEEAGKAVGARFELQSTVSVYNTA